MYRAKIRFITYTAALLCITAVYGYAANSAAVKYEHIKEMNYTRDLSDFVESVNEIQISLSKAGEITSATQLAMLSSHLYTLSDRAKTKLSELPFSEYTSVQLSSFLSELSSTSSSVIYNVLNGIELTPETSADIMLMSNYSKLLFGDLLLIQDMFFNNSRESMPEITRYESLFSYDNSDSNYYAVLKTSHEFNPENAKHKARQLLGRSIKLTDSVNTETEPHFYRYMCGNAYADITTNGGYLLHLVIDHRVTDVKLSEEEALAAISTFIEWQGFKALTLTSYSISDGLLNAVYSIPERDSVSVKVSVTLDTGKICFFDADNYLRNF